MASSRSSIKMNMGNYFQPQTINSVPTGHKSPKDRVIQTALSIDNPEYLTASECGCEQLKNSHSGTRLSCFQRLDLATLTEEDTTNGSKQTILPSERSIQLHTLIQRCVICFDSNGDLIEGTTLPYNFFLVFQWFLNGQALVFLMEQFYDACRDQCPSCSHNGCYVKLEGLQQAAAAINNGLIAMEKNNHNPFVPGPSCICTRAVARFSGCIRFWIALFPMHFDDNPQLCQSIMSLQRKLLADDLNEFAAFLDLSRVPSYAWLRNLSVRNPMTRQFSLCFDEWTPHEIATNLTHIEYKMLRRIQFPEYRQYACTSNLSSTPVLQRSIAAFNSLSGWVQCMVLSKVTPKERADFVVKFVNVAKQLRELHNFNTLMAIVGGLTHSAIARLTKTKNCVPPETQKELAELAELLASSSNFSNYRKALEQSSGARIPIM